MVLNTFYVYKTSPYYISHQILNNDMTVYGSLLSESWEFLESQYDTRMPKIQGFVLSMSFLFASLKVEFLTVFKLYFKIGTYNGG